MSNLWTLLNLCRLAAMVQEGTACKQAERMLRAKQGYVGFEHNWLNSKAGLGDVAAGLLGNYAALWSPTCAMKDGKLEYL